MTTVTYTEETTLFPCEGEAVVGILAKPATPGETGVVVVVGGPQTRAGSHRQFVLLSRALAAGGYAVLRFDYRGMGDSSGAQRDFEGVDADIAAAIDSIQARVPEVKQVVLWGLCDGASAALLYCHAAQDLRVRGLCLLNPWVRSEASLAKTQVKHYYTQRLRQKEFWIKLFSGKVALSALSGFAGKLRQLSVGPSQQTKEIGTFQQRMAVAWQGFGGRILLVLSGDDYTAKEFLEHAQTDDRWKGLLDQTNVQRHDFAGVDHTFSTSSARKLVADTTLTWLHTFAEAEQTSRLQPGSIASPIDHGGATAPRRALPRGPVLDWTSFKIVDAPGISSVEDLPHSIHLTSGRSAIYQALLQHQLPASSTVLIPTYHCPTMVAPVLLANLKVAYYGIRADGLPKLDTIDEVTAGASKAMVVPHYFGVARSLQEVRQWCDDRGIVLIEDCAHCFFGQAGDRPIGAWGDYATASLSKFLPVPEGGLLASAHSPLKAIQLGRQNIKAQVKGWVDVVELATRHKRLFGVQRILAMLFSIKNWRSESKPGLQTLSNGPTTADQMMQSCDMGRIKQAPLNATMVLKSVLPRGRVITRRRDNFARYAVHFGNVVGARSAYELPSNTVAPYVFPLWVDDAERVYREVRAQELPVFRWDRIWPGTPLLDGDVGPQWSHHVLQLLCHQDLSEADVDRTANAILQMLAAEPRSTSATT